MKKQFKYTPVALAVAAFIASPLALANQEGNDYVITGKADFELNLDSDFTHSDNSVSIDIEKDFRYDEDVYIDVDVDEEEIGTGGVSYSRALIDNKQSNKYNASENGSYYYDGYYYRGGGHVNQVLIDNNALRDASGNIGVNIAEGDYNQQDNSAALAAADAEMTFGIGDAQAHSAQDSEFNYTSNYGVTNSVSIGNNALRDASGNIGVNIATGTGNQQKNNLSASSSNGGVSLAMVTTDQESDRNYTHTTGTVVTLTSSSEFSGTTESWGTYSGISDQVGDLYVDNWSDGTTGLPNHPTDGSLLGHSDFDSAAQGAVDRNNDGGAFSFDEAGDIHLAGTFSGSAYSHTDVYLPSVNSVSLSNNALRGASGNIGVNIASGTGNQQVNSLAISASSGGAMGTAGGEF